MAGTLFGVPLSQQVGPDGRIASGALVYVYEANSSTPASTYTDFALTSEQTWPLECDSAGRVPAFYVSDGSYRLRITTSGGIELVDEQSITSIGASSSGSGGGSSAQDTTTLFQTGDMLWSPVSGTRTGWIRCNGRTVGNGASGAAERANGDVEAVFAYLWNNFSDSLCAVSGGRGGSATADFNAAKTITTLDMRSKTIFGLDTMGNSAASVTGGSSTAADAIGASTYTVALANLPSTSITVTNGTNLVRATTDTATVFRQISATDTGGEYVFDSLPTTVAVTATLGGSGTDIDILTPARVGTYYMKL